MMTEIKDRTIRQDGSVVNKTSALLEILYSDKDIGSCLLDDQHEVQRFQIANKLCDTQLLEPQYNSGLIYDGIKWRDYWLTPEPYASIDLLSWCLAKCNTVQEKNRVQIEIEEFEQRGMTAAIKHMIYCVDVWRANGIIWGVGRGSSVASFVLYLIGITRLNPLKYNLDLKEWLK